MMTRGMRTEPPDSPYADRAGCAGSMCYQRSDSLQPGLELMDALVFILLILFWWFLVFSSQ